MHAWCPSSLSVVMMTACSTLCMRSMYNLGYRTCVPFSIEHLHHTHVIVRVCGTCAYIHSPRTPFSSCSLIPKTYILWCSVCGVFHQPHTGSPNQRETKKELPKTEQKREAADIRAKFLAYETYDVLANSTATRPPTFHAQVNRLVHIILLHDL